LPSQACRGLFGVVPASCSGTPQAIDIEVMLSKNAARLAWRGLVPSTALVIAWVYGWLRS